MAGKKGNKAGKKVKSLRAKSLSGKKAKSVKGGSFSFGAITIKQTDQKVAQLGDGSVFKQKV
jgi:hypothetical protein